MCLINIYNVIIFNAYKEMSTPIIWLIIFLLILKYKNKSFYYIMIGGAITILFTSTMGYRSLSIFVLMSLSLSKDKIQRLISLILLLICSIISTSIYGNNSIDVFAIFVQFGFGVFCYFGFMHPATDKIMTHVGHIVVTEKEAKVLMELATRDIGQKELASELNVATQDLSRTIARARIRNGFITNEYLIRQYALEIFIKQQNK